jgi:hypothetical protein
MIMRLTGIGSQYLGAFVDATGEYFDGSKTYKMTLPPNIPTEKFWSLTVYDNQSRSMLDTPQRYPRTRSQSYPSPAAVANPDGHCERASICPYVVTAPITDNWEAGRWLQIRGKARRRSMPSMPRPALLLRIAKMAVSQTVRCS